MAARENVWGTHVAENVTFNVLYMVAQHRKESCWGENLIRQKGVRLHQIRNGRRLHKLMESNDIDDPSCPGKIKTPKIMFGKD